MKRPHVIAVAAAIPLLLTSLRLSAGELPYKAPTTELAKANAPLLHQTARALHDLPSSAALQLPSGSQISNLWLFPTAEADTVFARYNLTSDTQAAFGAGGSATEHLTVLTVRGNRIVASHELTSSHGTPASPHWTASIGAGTSATSTTTAADTKQTTSPGTQPVVATAHWTSRIGSGQRTSS